MKLTLRIPLYDPHRLQRWVLPRFGNAARFAGTRSVPIKVAAVALTLLGAAEIAARFSGVADFPIYGIDEGIGYIVKPNQAGRFLNKNAWFFNSKSMPTEHEWAPEVHSDIMLIGNSIVMGGNAYDQKDKLAPLISGELGSNFAIWPIATGGWSNVNEAVYVERNPDVVRAAKFFVWEYMYGGLHELSTWRGEYVFPSRHPLFASWYVFRRYVLPRLISINMNELPPSGELDHRHLENFEAAISKLAGVVGSKHPGIIFLYPDKAQLSSARHSLEWLPDRAVIQDICDRYGLTLVDVAQRPEWTESSYQGGTHPTAQGNAMLAHILALAITDTISLDQEAVPRQ
ncbi:MAG: uncharacterized protein JWN43_5085 [Gammaproteobacteria bacterium]|nr:uncharacterized protein [Gammaproteobacteria bacterium]